MLCPVLMYHEDIGTRFNKVEHNSVTVEIVSQLGPYQVPSMRSAIRRQLPTWTRKHDSNDTYLCIYEAIPHRIRSIPSRSGTCRLIFTRGERERVAEADSFRPRNRRICLVGLQRRRPRARTACSYDVVRLLRLETLPTQ